MGNSDSKDSNFPVSDFSMLGHVSDSFYGDVKLLRHKLSGRVFLTLAFSFNNKEDLQKGVLAAEKRRSLKSKGLIQQPYFYTEAKTNLCSNLFLLRKIIEYAPLPLSVEIQKRKEENKSFSEPEIWHILKNSLQGLEALKSIHMFHGDLRSNNTFISQSKHVKIIERGYLINELPSYAMMLSGDFTQCNPSPLVLKSLKTREKKPIHQPFKSDIFSLAVLLLELCLGEKSKKLYDFSLMEIDCQELERMLKEIEGKYSEKLCEFLTEMLKIDELERASVDYILTEIEEAEKRNYIKVAECLQLSVFGRNYVERAAEGYPVKIGSPTKVLSDFSNSSNKKNKYGDSPASYYRKTGNDYKDYSSMNSSIKKDSSFSEEFSVPARTYSEFNTEGFTQKSKRNDPFRRSLNENTKLSTLKEDPNEHNTRYKNQEQKFTLNEFDPNIKSLKSKHERKYSGYNNLSLLGK